MSTKFQSVSLDKALAPIPTSLRNKLLKTYTDLKSQSFGNHHDVIGVKSGKLSEIIIRVLQHILTGNYTPLTNDIGNFKSECEILEKTPKTSGPDGLRILMPRAISLLYTFRNKRDFGHSGGEVDANKIDALTTIRIADWCICELVRVVHKIPLEDAQLLCDAIAERRMAIIWNIMGRKRVLNTSLSYSETTLLLLYSEIEKGIPTEDLFSWTEHSHRSNYRRDVLGKLHRARLIEWDREIEMAIISPAGVAKVESEIIPKLEK